MAHSRSKGYEIDMCSGPILSGLLRFALPLTCSTMLQLLFNAADIIVVGRYAGDNALAAVGSNSSLISLLTNSFLGLSIGANILAARHYGAGEEDELQKTVHTSMLLSIIIGLLLSVVAIIGAPRILSLMLCPEDVFPLAVLYLRIYFLGMTATMLYNFGAALLRAVGDTQRPLYYLFFAGIVNVALNLIFVIRFHMGVAGVGIATVVSQCISAVLVVRCLVRERGAIHLDFKKLRIHRRKLKQIMQIGIPAGLQSALFSLANVVIQSSVNSFGEVIMAGNSAAATVENFVYAAINSFYQANASFTSQNLGAGNYRRIWKIFIQVQISALIVTLALSGLILGFGPQLLGLFSPSAEVVSAGMIRIRVICAAYGICSLMDVIVGSLRGIGYNILPMIVTLVGACGFRLLWIATVFQIPAFHSVQTVYFSYPISWILTFTVHLICFLIVYRKLGRHFEEPLL